MFNSQLPKRDDEGNQYIIDYDFKLGAPDSLQFTSNSIDPSCSVNIPIIGGKVTKKGKEFTVNPDIYTLLVSGIPLASANGTVGAQRNPQHSDKAFTFSSPNTTGVVTLNLGTAARAVKVDLQIAPEVTNGPKHVFLIDNEQGNLGKKVEIHLQDPHIGGKITWDFGHINNNLKPDNPKLNNPKLDNPLIPKSFRFAIYASDKAETVLSLFIQTDGSQKVEYGRNKQLQAGWIEQWDVKYNVSPIASPYSASVIFNNRLIIGFIENNSTNMTIKKSSDQPTTGGFKFTVLTHKKYHVDGKDEKSLYSKDYRSKVDEDLDDESKALHITIGQNVRRYAIHPHWILIIRQGDPDKAPSAQLDWRFTSSIEWNQEAYGGRGFQKSFHGRVDVTNKLEKTKPIDDSDLLNYLLHLDIEIVSSDWNKPEVKAEDVEWWQYYAGRREYTYDVVKALPSSLPTAKIEIINFNFFMTTNLLLPGNKVIKFDKTPGVRFPKDLYLVGIIAKKLE